MRSRSQLVVLAGSISLLLSFGLTTALANCCSLRTARAYQRAASPRAANGIRDLDCHGAGVDPESLISAADKRESGLLTLSLPAAELVAVEHAAPQAVAAELIVRTCDPDALTEFDLSPSRNRAPPAV